MIYETLTEACHAWVESFDAIPMSAIEKINEYDIEHTGCDSIVEITPISVGDRCFINEGKWKDNYGTICKSNYRGEGNFLIDIDGENQKRIVSGDDIEIIDRDPFPIWGIMWAFPDQIDIEWATGEYLGPHLQEIADCGFRIYQSDDFGILLGIDGAGYNFYDAHWIPLYKARGLHWHKTDDTEKVTA